MQNLQDLSVAFVQLGGFIQNVFERAEGAVAFFDARRLVDPSLVLAQAEVLDYLGKVDLDLRSLVIAKLLDGLWLQCKVQQLCVLHEHVVG